MAAKLNPIILLSLLLALAVCLPPDAVRAMLLNIKPLLGK
jgi:hypothetical protein